MVHIFETFNRYSHHKYFNCTMMEAFAKFQAEYSLTEDEAVEKYDFDRSR
jgi:hypothetical protein